MECALNPSTPLPPLQPPMTRMESWLTGTTAIDFLAVGSEAIFFQELLGTSNTLISTVETPCSYTTTNDHRWT